MNNIFNKQYLKLLSEQVADEIAYLQRHGHDAAQIYIPCMFCVKHINYYSCRRLEDLRRFQASIRSHDDSKLREIPLNRRKIGSEVKNEKQFSINSILPRAIDLPLMYPKL